MSKRRTKKQQKQIDDGVKVILILTAGVTYYLTRSLAVAIMSLFIAIILILAIVIYQNSKHKERLRNSGITEIDAMDGIQFEHYLKELYLIKGFSAEVTKASGDYGGDLLLKKDGKKIVVQAKRYSKDVGIKAVQEVIGAKSYYSADEAWVVSNRYFTKAAIELAQKSHIKLVDRDELIDEILGMNSGVKTISQTQTTPVIPIPTIPSSSDSTCIRCGSPRVLRTGKRGNFLGCSSFPKCRYTKNIERDSHSAL
ncbi:restriction system protein [Bacillus sp. SLBN-46]|uniref:restriction endonuclease n=1 Tax=Bacillus sp. SLBN-46 TaxID=3042283 RepID=UPI00285C6A12|nr:restriction endonuclease [Bacillus sp. SLBN-46]MDR6121347.1 restriction system protein [Bacillus sp. SLBN-46]